jgi:hypothetical protein
MTALVIDVVFNPEPLAKFDDREYRATVAQFAMFNVQQKFSIELSPGKPIQAYIHP